MKRSLTFNEDSSLDLIERRCKQRSDINAECRVCGDSAHGYNFNQITCESCKAFFRRNASKQMCDLKCRYSGSCKITTESRRQCTYCRLKKCFDIQMKKEWIQTVEELYLKKLKRFSKLNNKHLIMEKKKTKFHFLHHLVNSKQPIYPIYRSFSDRTLTIDDWSLINNINQTYDLWSLECDTNHIKNYSVRNTSLKDFLNDEQQMYKSLIQFYKQIPQFKQINLEDQILLIKCNLTHLIHLHHILKDHFIENSNIGLLMTQWINKDFHEQMSKTRHSLDFFTEYPIVLKITLVTFMFIINLSKLPYEQLSFEIIQKDFLNENLNFYITLLWKYLNVILNEKDAIKAIQCIVFQFLRYQLLMDQMEHIIIQQNNSDQFHPLTKSLLRLT